MLFIQRAFRNFPATGLCTFRIRYQRKVTKNLFHSVQNIHECYTRVFKSFVRSYLPIYTFLNNLSEEYFQRFRNNFSYLTTAIVDILKIIS